jgi:ABC-type transport system involved in multi-copper enzyme maturation permease subunit
MYLWKFWRDTRRGAFIYVGLLFVGAAIWLASMLHANRIGHISGDPGTLWMMDVGLMFAFSYMCALIMAFVVGNNNVGSDIGNGTGDFLLTRPRSRSYFVWTAWIAGIVELLGLILFTGVFVFGLSVLAAGPVWRHVSSPLHFSMSDKGESAILSVPLMLVTVILTAAVIYGLTYFLSVVLRSGQRGVVCSIAILFAYSITTSLLKQFAGISLPSLNFTESSLHSSGVSHLAPWVQMAGWTLLALAFPFTAQITLDRTDI